MKTEHPPVRARAPSPSSGPGPAGSALLRLGAHHFAYLRAHAEGVDRVHAARLYLGLHHAAELPALHRQVVERARALVRRRGDPRWRLIGLNLDDRTEPAVRLADSPPEALPAVVADTRAPPPIDDWAEEQGLSDWSSDELLALYEERFGSARAPRTAGAATTAAAPGRPSERRRQARNARLRERRMELLGELAASAGEPAAASDLLEGWLPPALTDALRQVGDLTLKDLEGRIRRGGRWYAVLPAYGPVKAKRLAEFVSSLLAPSPVAPFDRGGTPPSPAARRAPAPPNAPQNLDLFDGSSSVVVRDLPALLPAGRSEADLRHLSGLNGANRVAAIDHPLDARDDTAAIARWIGARATSEHTATQYRREAERFVLFCVVERHKPLSAATEADCLAYKAFLQAIPANWISRHNVAPMAPGWAPFRGALSVASQRQALTIVSALFAWLVQARYLRADPWVLVNRKLGDDPDAHEDPTSRAFTPQAWAVMHAWLNAAAPANRHDGEGRSIARLRWICTFVEAVGLRASELLRAERAHLRESRAGWILQVHGKGRRNRVVPVPQTAIAATRVYFASRELDFADCAPETPLVASLADGSALRYAALHETFTRFVRRAVIASKLSAADKVAAERASAHWLRHTYATRSAERGVAPDILQENLGQSDPRTTARYYRAQIERRQAAMERAFGAESIDGAQ